MAASGSGLGRRVVSHPMSDHPSAVHQPPDPYRTVFDRLPAPVVVHRGGSIVHVNGALARLLGVRDIRKLIGRELVDFVDTAARPVEQDQLRSLYDGDLLRSDLRLRTVDGTVVHVESTCGPIVLDGEPAVLTMMQDVTDRVRAETDLRSSESRFRSLLQRGSDLVAVLDRDGTCTYISPAARQLLGRDPSEVVGTVVFDLLHPADADVLTARFGDYLGDEESEHGPFQVRVRRSDGRWRHVELLVENMLDVPHVAGVVVSGWDTTDRTRAERALRTSEARFRALVQHASDMIGVVDAAATFSYVSPAVTAALGWEPEEVLGRHLFHFVHPEDHGALCELLRTRWGDLTEGIPTVYRAPHKDGSWRWIESFATNRYDDPAVRGLVINARDVTWRMEAEAEIRSSEARHRALVEHISDVVVVVDPDGRVRYANPALERVLGWPPDVAIGQDLFSRLHEDDGDAARGWMSAAVEAGPGLYGPYRVRIRDRGGRWRYLEATANNRLDDPAVRGFVVVGRDVSSQAAAEESLRHLALHDPLTGLANRTLVADRLRTAVATAQRRGGSAALLILDLDGFKHVNDTLGHAVGDAVLVKLADRMRSVLRDVDTVGRLGGDEFAVVLPSVGASEDALDAAARLLGALTEGPVRVEGEAVDVGASIGLALAPVHGSDPDALLRHADAAMFRAKQAKQGIAVCEAGDLVPRVPGRRRG